MKEFGSDFYIIENFKSEHAHLTSVYNDSLLLASGRQCIIALIRQYGWKRIWFPEYFCYDVIRSIVVQTGIEVVFYFDYPGYDDKSSIRLLKYQKGDVLFRVNYFGMRDMRSNKDIPIPVIEDHTHDLLGQWALNSNADWCIASLRKSIPIPEGGMMWSPKGHRINVGIPLSEDNKEIAYIRWEAMQMKADYLLGGKNTGKESFRKKYIETEERLACAGPSLIDEKSMSYIEQLDFNLLQYTKYNNWQVLKEKVRAKIILPEKDSFSIFSFVILAHDEEERNSIRRKLIECSVYPAILWRVPESASIDVRSFSQRMLSIHCDVRYTKDDMRQLATIINKSI